ncbi:MAG: hypothetical protein JWQ94_3741 [Tardiphaga sp.]|nr:hypothetical protein [Tardiphaga sp.]
MSDELMPAGLLVKVEMTVRIPVAATWEQIEEYVSSEITGGGGVALDNPLLAEGLEEWANTFEIDSDGIVGIREEFDHKDMPDGGRSYKVRYREVRP